MSGQASLPVRTVRIDVPGGLLLHPAVLAAIALFVVNDHVFKPAHPGWLTGKLSDVAGLVFFTLAAVTGGRRARTFAVLGATFAVAAFAGFPMVRWG